MQRDASTGANPQSHTGTHPQHTCCRKIHLGWHSCRHIHGPPEGLSSLSRTGSRCINKSIQHACFSTGPLPSLPIDTDTLPRPNIHQGSTDVFLEPSTTIHQRWTFINPTRINETRFQISSGVNMQSRTRGAQWPPIQMVTTKTHLWRKVAFSVIDALGGRPL